MKRIWDEEGHLRRLQQVWQADPALAQLDYVRNYDLWRNSNGLQERIAGLSLMHLLKGETPIVRRDDIEDFVEDLRSGKQLFHVIAPISGVCIEERPLVLSDQVSVRRLEPLEHEFLINSSVFRDNEGVRRHWWHRPTVIETKLAVDYHRKLETRMDEAANLVSRVCLLLSLVTDVDVLTPGLFGSVGTGFPMHINYFEPQSGPYGRDRPWPLPVDCGAREAVLSLWGRVEATDTQTQVALGRLSHVLERDADVDRLIDAWIALEAMFSGDLKGELSYRLALRIANFLEDQPLRKQERFSALRTSYDYRSRLVHGRKKQPKSADVAAVAAETVTIARRCILKILESGVEFKPDRLDEAPFLDFS